nr:hypothetical protein [uncultured bacterium]
MAARYPIIASLSPFYEKESHQPWPQKNHGQMQIERQSEQ